MELPPKQSALDFSHRIKTENLGEFDMTRHSEKPCSFRYSECAVDCVDNSVDDYKANDPAAI